MEIVHFVYDNQEVDFLPTTNENLMVNATQMAKIFNKRIENFTRIDSTKDFINECLKNANKRYLNVENESDLINSKQKSGTWMHRILALKFAAWLSPKFELWVFYTIDKILLGHFSDVKEAAFEKFKLEKQLQEKKSKLIAEHPELAEVFELELKLNESDKKRIKAIKASIGQLRFAFDTIKN